jgi:hypothetical protein
VADDALTLAKDELHAALSDLENQLARGAGPGEVRLSGDGELIIPPLTAEDVPADAEALRAELGAMLPACRSRRCWWRSTPGSGSPTTSCTPAAR